MLGEKRGKDRGEGGKEKPDDVMRFVVKEGDRVSRANAPTPPPPPPPPQPLFVSFFQSHTGTRKGRPRVSADVASRPYLASQGRKKKKGKERGRQRPKFHIRFLSKTDLKSAAAFKAQRERGITISEAHQSSHFEVV